VKANRPANLGSPLFKFSYRVFPSLFERAAKPSAILAVLLLLVSTACAQTNFFPVLECKNRAYTNATIESFTPATVTIFWDGGGERIPITNLPPELLTRYHYDPQAAQAYLDEQAAKKAAMQERADQALAAIARARGNLGPAQQIHIVKIYSEIHLQIEAGDKVSDAYIHNLPPDFFTSLSELNQTKSDAANLEAQIAQEQSAANQSAPTAARPRAQKAAVSAQKNAAHSARTAATDTTAALAKVKARLKELESRTTISACRTDYINSVGIRQWEYQAAATAGLNPK
jgi:hypothetical protein